MAVTWPLVGVLVTILGLVGMIVVVYYGSQRTMTQWVPIYWAPVSFPSTRRGGINYLSTVRLVYPVVYSVMEVLKSLDDRRVPSSPFGVLQSDTQMTAQDLVVPLTILEDLGWIERSSVPPPGRGPSYSLSAKGAIQAAAVAGGHTSGLWASVHERFMMLMPYLAVPSPAPSPPLPAPPAYTPPRRPTRWTPPAPPVPPGSVVAGIRAAWSSARSWLRRHGF